jgi:hypothetical protein
VTVPIASSERSPEMSATPIAAPGASTSPGGGVEAAPPACTGIKLNALNLSASRAIAVVEMPE